MRGDAGGARTSPRCVVLASVTAAQLKPARAPGKCASAAMAATTTLIALPARRDAAQPSARVQGPGAETLPGLRRPRGVAAVAGRQALACTPHPAALPPRRTLPAAASALRSAPRSPRHGGGAGGGPGGGKQRLRTAAARLPAAEAGPARRRARRRDRRLRGGEGARRGGGGAAEAGAGAGAGGVRGQDGGRGGGAAGRRGGEAARERALVLLPTAPGQSSLSRSSTSPYCPGPATQGGGGARPPHLPPAFSVPPSPCCVSLHSPRPVPMARPGLLLPPPGGPGLASSLLRGPSPSPASSPPPFFSPDHHLSPASGLTASCREY